MAELARGSSRIQEIGNYLTNTVGLPESSVHEYTAGLVAEGYDSVDLFDDLKPNELKDDFGFKLGHARKVEKSQKERQVGRFAPKGGGSRLPTVLSEPEPEPEPAEEGEPVGNELADGSQVEVLKGDANLLGRGASGIVTKGVRTWAGAAGKEPEHVACKMLAPGATPREHNQFHSEYQISMKAAMSCPGAARTYGCFRHDGALCLVMRLYAKSLLDVLEPPKEAPLGTKRTPLAVDLAIDYGKQLANGLQQLHAVGIKVGDLKPANLLLDEANNLVVADFGISEAATNTVTSTKSGGGGTPAYTAPEQYDSDLGESTFPVDIWAWACIMVEMLSGVTPWQGMKAQKIMAAVIMKKKHPELPAEIAARVPPHVRGLIDRCFALKPDDRPKAAQLFKIMSDAPTKLTKRKPGDEAYTHADSLLQNTWFKKDLYELSGIMEVREIDNPRLTARYEAYKGQISSEEVPNGNELLMFHGCAPEAMDVDNPDSIVQTGFLKKYWKTSAGDWQRFGPGFYFGPQASKAHEYPLPQMQKLPPGFHTRKMLLCKVARGKIHKTATNIDTLQGHAPEGFDSVHGDAQKTGDLNYDEIVVYKEEAVLPFAVVEYKFHKRDLLSAGGGGGGGGGAAGAAAATGPFQRKLKRVAVAGMGLLGPGVAAEFALHGIEVRVWNDPKWCQGKSAADFSKAKVSEALRVADMVQLSPANREAGGGSDRFAAADRLVTGHNTVQELVSGCQIVIDAISDRGGLQPKVDLFQEACKCPTLPADAFLTTNMLMSKFGLRDIASTLPAARRQFVLGLRFYMRGPQGSQSSVGIRVVEGTYISDTDSSMSQLAQLAALAKLVVEADKVLIMPSMASGKARGWENLSPKGLPHSHYGCAEGSWDLKKCQLCAAPPDPGSPASSTERAADLLFVCLSCQHTRHASGGRTQFQGGAELIAIAKACGYMDDA